MFFFFKQKTAYEMRISDWSSDVCSSDLDARGVAASLGHVHPACRRGQDQAAVRPQLSFRTGSGSTALHHRGAAVRGSCTEPLTGWAPNMARDIADGCCSCCCSPICRATSTAASWEYWLNPSSWNSA